MKEAWGIIFPTGEVLTVRPVVEGGAVLHEVVQKGIPDPIAYSEWSPDADSAAARLRLLAMALASVMIKQGDERFLDHLISILPPPEPKADTTLGTPAKAGECSAAGAATAGEGSLSGREEPGGSKRNGGAMAEVSGGNGTIPA